MIYKPYNRWVIPLFRKCNVLHFQQRMSWLPQRWRTQRNAIRLANCIFTWVIKDLNAPCTHLWVYLLEYLFSTTTQFRLGLRRCDRVGFPRKIQLVSILITYMLIDIIGYLLRWKILFDSHNTCHRYLFIDVALTIISMGDFVYMPGKMPLIFDSKSPIR
jgi:hypothetical protein